MKKLNFQGYSLDFETSHPLHLLDAAVNIGALIYEGWEVTPTNYDENLFWYDPEKKIIHIPTTNVFSMREGLVEAVKRIFS